MRIERLTLSGFLRFHQPLTIDLTDVPPGLIALVGENGAGKSTLLEAVPATLYRSFLSRGDLIDYATRRDSMLDLQVTLEGRGTYRARVNVDGPKRASDAVLEAIEADGRRAALNDGKVSTYDQAIAQVFPSKTLLLSSAFAAQNKAGSFLALDKKARKTLFMELLGIERYATMSETARQAGTLLEQARARLLAARTEVARGTGPEVDAALEAAADTLAAQASAVTATRAALQTEIARREAELATQQDAVAAFGAATLRVVTLRAERDRQHETRAAAVREADRIEGALLRDLERLQEGLTQERRACTAAADTAHATLARDLQRIEATRTAEQDDCAAKVAGNQQILGMATAIRAAVARLAAIDAEVGDLRRALAANQVHPDDRRRLEALEQEWQGLDTVRERLRRAQTDAGLLATVPCAGDGPYAGCRLLTNAQQAHASVAALTAHLVAEEARIGPALEVARGSRVTREEALRDLQQRADALEADRPGLARHAKYAEPLAAAEARIAELKAQQAQAEDRARQQRAEADRRHRETLAGLEAREQAAAARYQLATQETQRAAETARSDVSARLAQIDQEATATDHGLQEAEQALAAATAQHTRVAALQVALAEARGRWDVSTAQHATLAAETAALARRREDLASARARALDLDRRLERLGQEAIDWQLLAKAFSRDGLPVLEIDAAGPTISAVTNDLLEACFGARFSLELVTQQATADGKGLKEAFTVLVTDNASGAARDIGDLSGGEQVIVTEALMNAVAIYVNTRAAAPIRTCWRDETTGALDPENAQRYAAMLRRAHALGGFHHTFFVSHNPDVSALADAQIQIAGGRARVVFPPFPAVGEEAVA